MTHIDPENPIPEQTPEQPGEFDTPPSQPEIDPGATPDEMPAFDPGGPELTDSRDFEVG